MAPKTALITGGTSGIGLALVRHLLANSWRVIIANRSEASYEAVAKSLDTTRTVFIPTDVVSWESNSHLFSEAFAWSNGQIDLFLANSGAADLETLLPLTEDDEEMPTKPDTTCIDLNTIGALYGLRLFVYYARKTQRTRSLVSTPAGNSAFHPKMIVTGSTASLYPFPPCPQYTASKHALVGLIRSVGPNLFRTENIALNMTCPAFIPTALSPPGLKDSWPQDWITPTSTVARAIDELIDNAGAVQQDGRSDGVNGVVKAGQVIECALDHLYYRSPVQFADESQKFLIEQSYESEGLWMKGIRGELA